MYDIYNKIIKGDIYADLELKVFYNDADYTTIAQKFEDGKLNTILVDRKLLESLYNEIGQILLRNNK